MMQRPRWWTFAPVLLGLMVLAAAPPPPEATARSPLVVRIGVDLVQIDAVVTDHDHHPLANLKISDFELLQDGAPQAITHFEYIAVPVPPRPTASPAVAADATAVELRHAEDIHRTIAFVVGGIGR